jgi:hypothetical protein
LPAETQISAVTASACCAPAAGAIDAPAAAAAASGPVIALAAVAPAVVMDCSAPSSEHAVCLLLSCSACLQATAAAAAAALCSRVYAG